MIVRINTLLSDTTSEGPGHRFCVWVQGCERHCPGCFARHTWDQSGGIPVEVRELCELIGKRLTQNPSLEGITLLGGEPFLQAEALAHVASFAHEQSLGVLCFTGYTLEELREAGPAGSEELLDVVDVLIDGPYLREERDFSRPLVGSRNQRFHFLTNRYDKHAFQKAHNRVEVRMSRDGSIEVNGMASFFGSAEDTRQTQGGQQ